MKNGTTETLESKVERDERAKKLYRYVNDVARRVGEMTASSKSVVDLFAMDIELYRQKLRDNCEKLLFLDPLNYGKKTLELLWRKVYYDTVSAAKKLHETDNDNSSYLFTHLVCGIGHFHHLISRIQLEMNVQHKELDYIAAHIDDEFNEKNDSLPVTDIELQFGRSILYSCLIYLGDLSRYQAEIFMTFDSSIAARYYLQAAHIDLASGMPYNQLANLYLDKNYNIDSVCYYIHCLNCTTPFEGAMDNLEKIFEKNSQFIDSTNDTESLTQAEHIQNTIVNFLSLIDLWYFEKNDTNISERCSMIIQGLKVSMDFDQTQMPDPNKSYSEYIQTVEEESTCPSYLHPNLILKIVQICLFTIQKLTETDETKAFACKAFTLALLSQLVQRLVKNLESIGLKNPASEYRGRTATSIKESETDVIIEEVVDPPLTETKLPIELPANGKDYSDEETDRDIENIVEIDKAVNGDVKNNAKKVMSKRRRRRRILSSGSSDESVAEIDNSDVETFESCSEEEQSDSDSLLTDEDSQNDSEEDTDKENDEKINSDVFQESVKLSEPQTTENCTETDINKNKKEGSNSNNVTNKTSEEKLKMFLLGDNIMSSVKLLQDWAMSEKDLILSCGDSGESLFQSVVDLLNIFTHNFTLKRADEDNDDCNFLKYARSIVEKVKLEYKMTPLPEDINLRGTNICKFDKDAAEWQFLDRCKPSVYEESIIRILNFIDFGNFIANIVPRIRFNRTMKIFFIKNVNAPTLSMKINHKKSKEWHNSKKQHAESLEGGLLSRLGRLWLVSQVRELERSGRQPTTPTLVALDTAALHRHLRRVKQLMRARNFILLIPAVVLQELDSLKREESSARDAIRWLELQLKAGSRFLRAQRDGQSRPLPLLKCPRKAPPHIQNFMQILEFCNHFIGDEKQNLDGSGDAETSNGKSTPFLVLLLGNQSETDEVRYKEFSVTGAAKSVGISVEYIEDFYAKWRQIAHKSGKKR